MIQRVARVEENVSMAPAICRLRVYEPELAPILEPGQFVMVRAHGRVDPLLARPLALYDTYDDAGDCVGFDLVYLVMGRGTETLSTLRPGDSVDVWGPLGNSFPSAGVDDAHLWLMAGGIGQTPFVSVIKQRLGRRTYGSTPQARSAQKVTLLWGVRTESLLAGLDDFQATGADVFVATEDGSSGTRGRVTDLADERWNQGERPTAVFACGPEPMLAAVHRWTEQHGIPTWVSLETGMACGYGVCFSCVCPMKDASQAAGFDYRRVCVEGPVFPSDAVAWDAF